MPAHGNTKLGVSEISPRSRPSAAAAAARAEKRAVRPAFTSGRSAVAPNQRFTNPMILNTGRDEGSAGNASATDAARGRVREGRKPQDRE